MNRKLKFCQDRPAILADLIAPTSTEAFFDTHWEKTFLYVDTAKPGRFAEFFSSSEIESWVLSTRGGWVFVLHPAGEDVRIETHQARDLAPRAIFDHFRNGSAQILKKLGDWPALQGLVQHLRAVFHADVEVNAFLSPAGARTHPIYTANDDIFVLQLEGEEVWRLHELTLLQLDLSQKKHLVFPQEWQHRTETPVLAELRLRPGDLLYIPRGMPHHAMAPDTAGLRLHIYVTPLFWMDAAKIAAEHAALHAPELRRALPPGFVEDEAIREQMAGTFEQVMQRMQDVSFREVLSTLARNRVVHQGVPPGSPFAPQAGAGELSGDSEVERSPNVLCTVEEVVDASGKPKSAIFFGDHQINTPPGLGRALRFIRDHPTFRVSEVPGLDAKSQIVLVRRLVNEGLLRVVAAGDVD